MVNCTEKILTTTSKNPQPSGPVFHIPWSTIILCRIFIGSGQHRPYFVSGEKWCLQQREIIKYKVEKQSNLLQNNLCNGTMNFKCGYVFNLSSRVKLKWLLYNIVRCTYVLDLHTCLNTFWVFKQQKSCKQLTITHNHAW